LAGADDFVDARAHGAGVIPFGSQLGGEKMVIADLNVGILLHVRDRFLWACYGIVLAGLRFQLQISFSWRHSFQRPD